MKQKKKILVKILKIAISVILLYFVFTKVPFKEIWIHVKSANLLFLFLSFIALLASQLVSSSRLLLFFKSQSFNISSKSNLKLYFIGMFYNFFIPGGIGGDAYKIYLLNKQFKWSAKKLTSAVFFDRISGLIAIGLWILLLLFPLKLIQEFKIHYIIPAAILALVFGAKYAIKKLNSNYNAIYLRALVYSFLIQGLQVFCVLFILKALAIDENYLEYLILFLVSAVLSVISFSGIGVREFLFLKAAEYLNYNAEISIAIGLIFTLITILISASGLYFEFSKNKIELSEN